MNSIMEFHNQFEVHRAFDALNLLGQLIATYLPWNINFPLGTSGWFGW